MSCWRFRRRRVGLAARLARAEVQLRLDASDERLVGKVLVHPVQVLIAALHDAERVPQGIFCCRKWVPMRSGSTSYTCSSR